jgi:hypothetical protein
MTKPSLSLWNLAIFYHFQFGLGSGRSYAFTRYNYSSHTSTNVCINCVPSLPTPWGTVVGQLRAQPTLRSPFSFHVVLVSHILDGLDYDIERLRQELLGYVGESFFGSELSLTVAKGEEANSNDEFRCGNV